ncbi:histidyl-tRNA synthetase [Ruaniaceae bacterium KH17]|nr:histidyl-tRNA synthetase [Ruaniaceae bacterium KH17]
MSRASLSGFPELTPQERIVEQYVLDHVRRTFELHGFAGIETRAVEPLESLLRKGETSKEVYVLGRLQDEPGAKRGRELALHFDLTVPLARYVLEHTGDVAFPFKRYQIQKSWRGERPQEGRFREFTQADIDVVGQDTLPFQYEVDVALVMCEVLAGLPIGGFTMRVNNRKLCDGAYRSMGIEDREGTLRVIDKLAKIGPDGVKAELSGLGLTPEQIDGALALASIQSRDTSFVEQVRALVGSNETLEEGLAELAAVIEGGDGEHMLADLSIARGLDYYTGTVYETTLDGREGFGAISAGGRYDSLVSDGKRTYPGVGLSLGVTRLVAALLADNTATRQVPTAVLVAVTSEESRVASRVVAGALRLRGIPAEVMPSAEKFGKQIRYADRRGIPFVWFPESGEVKDIRSGDQVAADPATWSPPEEDLWPRMVARKQG